jgi:trans-2,3-dihydro-3-hydroxyanthranilate isomerase
MQTRRFMIVDVFTDRPLTGNQLAVFSNATGMADEQMQALASEIGFSETTFITPAENGGDFRMRIFTPKREIPFAGHPTLGTAFALGGPLQSSLVRIETGMGIVPVLLEREGAKIVFGRMQQPVPTITPFAENSQDLFDALGAQGSVVPVETYDNGVQHCYVILGTHAEVAAVKPDLGRLGAVLGESAANVAAVEAGRVKTRCFVPGLGVGEDPATGSAAGPLAAHLARHGLAPWGETVEISQGAEIGRPSTLYARADGSDAEGISAIEVGGSAIVVGRGEFLV